MSFLKKITETEISGKESSYKDGDSLGETQKSFSDPFFQENLEEQWF